MGCACPPPALAPQWLRGFSSRRLGASEGRPSGCDGALASLSASGTPHSPGQALTAPHKASPEQGRETEEAAS